MAWDPALPLSGGLGAAGSRGGMMAWGRPSGAPAAGGNCIAVWSIVNRGMMRAGEATTALHPTRRRVLEYLASDDPEARQFAYDVIPDIDDEWAGSLAAGEGHERLSYGEYLTTEPWLEYRRAVLDRQGRKCATCLRDATHCHHRTYEHLGWEADDDCVGLCSDCHARLHAPRVIPRVRGGRRRP